MRPGVVTAALASSSAPACGGSSARCLSASGARTACGTSLSSAGVGAGAAREAEAIVASAMTSMTRAGFVARNELERELMHGRAETQALKQEVASSLREASASMKHSTETLQAENEKLRADLKYNIDRITQSQKLDLNLEKGRLRELHGIQESQMKEVEARVDRELHQMRTQIEAAKTEIIRYSVGTLVSLGALSLAAIRLVM